ncbi:branched-chain amino acid ABC transporter permease [Spongiactinospora sp. TRM90649]|uniref:branched-chain amino acid ABC transporter permease n=1 Tax=Spongiactinospora sp. TRM90649 TaxID=3031114 RepID=UPI0023F7FAFC|nr:branched-chain amino acid ABC transporter permease [Spongiactinospora sp. TRM90649]MDF5758081.1 branched-chain amino acid ABC transporter permease [Spongiactinospora sp. TRM90649]
MIKIVQNLLDALSVGATYALLALGLTLIFSVMNLINFAYGLLLVWGAYAAYALGAAGVPFVLVVPLCVIFVTVLSMVMGRVAFRPFIGAPPITLLITSFGVLLVGQYLAILIFGEKPHVLEVPAFLNSVITAGELRIPALQLITIASGVLIVGAFYALLNRTAFGARLRASAEQPETARLMGIKPDRVLMLAFAISGVIAGVVGLLWFVKVGAVTPRSDLEPTLKAFIALVLGGLGRVSGAILGGLALGAIEVLMNITLPAGAIVYAQAIVFAIVIAILVLRPGGLGGTRTEAA